MFTKIIVSNIRVIFGIGIILLTFSNNYARDTIAITYPQDFDSVDCQITFKYNLHRIINWEDAYYYPLRNEDVTKFSFSLLNSKIIESAQKGFCGPDGVIKYYKNRKLQFTIHYITFGYDSNYVVEMEFDCKQKELLKEGFPKHCAYRLKGQEMPILFEIIRLRYDQFPRYSTDYDYNYFAPLDIQDRTLLKMYIDRD